MKKIVLIIIFLVMLLAPIIPIGEESKINGDTTSAIEQELNDADLSDLDAEFQDIDSELKNL